MYSLFKSFLISAAHWANATIILAAGAAIQKKYILPGRKNIITAAAQRAYNIFIHPRVYF
jgi:hypothetical protein